MAQWSLLVFFTRRQCSCSNVQPSTFIYTSSSRSVQCVLYLHIHTY